MTSEYSNMKGIYDSALSIGFGLAKFKKKEFSNKDANKAYKFIEKYRAK